MHEWGPPPFRFEIMWLKEKSFDEVIYKWWNKVSVDGGMGFQLAQNLTFLKK